ncbi:LptF/LptG family permease [candidate division KSB1 bacterium]|nr:LptF/LptG family permease [candidate division KSB1 bacterium]
MKLVDKYLIHQFVTTLMLTIFAFIIIYLMVDFIENLRRFLDNKVPLNIVGLYYLYYIPYILILIIPMAVLLTTLFLVGRLANHNEITAMKAGGISLYRIFLPLLVLSLLISGFALFFAEIAVPAGNKARLNLKRHYVEKVSKKLSSRRGNIYFQGTGGDIFHIGYFDGGQNIAHGISLQRVQHNLVTRRVDAARMIWTKDGWILKDGIMREFTRAGESITRFRQYRGMGFTFGPQDLAKVQTKPEEMGYLDLKKFILRLRQAGSKVDRWLVDLYLKISFPLASFIIVLIGAPIAAHRHRGGTILSFGLGIFIIFLFFGAVQVGRALAYSGTLPPLLSAWLGNILFGVGGGILLAKVRK